jgi:hypothetical protein
MNVTRIARTYALAERPGTEGEAMSAYCTLLRSVGDEGTGILRQSATPAQNIAAMDQYVRKCVSEVAHAGDRAKFKNDQDMAHQGAQAVLAVRLAHLGPGAIKSIQQVAGADYQPMLKVANGIWVCATTTVFVDAATNERLGKWVKSNKVSLQSVLLNVVDHVVPYGFVEAPAPEQRRQSSTSDRDTRKAQPKKGDPSELFWMTYGEYIIQAARSHVILRYGVDKPELWLHMVSKLDIRRAILDGIILDNLTTGTGVDLETIRWLSNEVSNDTLMNTLLMIAQAIGDDAERMSPLPEDTCRRKNSNLVAFWLDVIAQRNKWTERWSAEISPKGNVVTKTILVTSRSPRSLKAIERRIRSTPNSHVLDFRIKPFDNAYYNTSDGGGLVKIEAFVKPG